MDSIGMSGTDNHPLCSRVEDTEHRVKQCPYLEVPIQLTRDLYHPIKDEQGKMIESSRICLEHQQKSLETEQGILMRTAVAALWRYRCEVRYQRTSASREGYLAWWDGELRQWGQDEATAVPTASKGKGQGTPSEPGYEAERSWNAGQIQVCRKSPIKIRRKRRESSY